jgi:hypothetical protein
MTILLKLARTQGGKYNPDDFRNMPDIPAACAR